MGLADRLDKPNQALGIAILVLVRVRRHGVGAPFRVGPIGAKKAGSELVSSVEGCGVVGQRKKRVGNEGAETDRGVGMTHLLLRTP